MAQKQETEGTPLQKELNELQATPDRNVKHVAQVAKADPPKTTAVQAPAQTNPMFLDSSHHREILQNLEGAANKYFHKPFAELKPIEKAEVLLRAIRDPEFFNFQYDKGSTRPPKTVEETFAAKSGNCDELVRLYLAIASKPEVGLKNLSQFYVMFKSETTGNKVGHTAIFYVEGTVVFIDPAHDEFKPFPKKFKTPQDVMRDQNFKKYILESASRITNEKGPFVIDEIAHVTGRKNFDFSYYFNYGDYATEHKE